MADTQQFGGKIKYVIAFIAGFVGFQLLFYLVINPRNHVAPKLISELQIDSLNHIIDSLQTEIFYLEDGFDSKEHRYEDVISEYEIGLSYLKDYHPKAYQDFHRILGMKEKYSRQLDRDNNKRLKINE